MGYTEVNGNLAWVDDDDEMPSSYNECLYCGEPMLAPALYCCEEHEEHRSLS